MKPPQVIELEKELGFELRETKDISDILDWKKSKVYLIDNTGEIIGLNLGDCELNNISFLQNFDKLKYLDLYRNQITDFSSLENLYNLIHLNLALNKITDIYFLKNLTNLKILNLALNKITNLECIQNLKDLTILNLKANQISSISALKNLVDLKELYLGYNIISDISPLQNMINLTSLGLEKHQILDFSFLKNKINLKYLDLRDAQVLDTSFFETLSKLKSLGLDNTQTSNLSFLKDLANLEELYLNSNQVLDVSPLQSLITLKKLELYHNQIIDISPLRSLKNLTNLGLRDNPFFLDLPVEIKMRPDLEILQYWIDTYTKKEKPLPIRETKVVFIGEGGTGKTSLMHLLLYGNKVDTKRTEKIEIHTDTKQFTYQDEALKLRFWDFGGQDIMHATHKFFMSERTLYVLVSNGRKNEDEILENWVEMLKSSIGDSPVLLVANHLDNPEDTHRIPDAELKKRLKSLKLPVIETSWETGRGIEKLKDAIQETLQTMPHFKEELPPVYQEIKEKLEVLEEDYIDYKHFERICQEVAQSRDDVFARASQNVLAGFLNDLGVMLNFQRFNDKLEDLLIFKPDWIVDGVYKIINSGEAQSKKGRVNDNTIHQLLKSIGYQTAQERSFIVEMMKHFKLAYQTQNIHSSYYLIPSLFDKNRPVSLEKPLSDTLKVSFEYDIWRNDYISYFLVSQHDNIEEGQYWINGALLNYGEHKVFIEAVRREKSIVIEIEGSQDKRYALWRVREALQEVHQMFDEEKLGIEQWLIYEEDEKTDKFSIDYLKQALDDGEKTFYSAKFRRRLNIAELLEGVNISEIEELNFLRKELVITSHAPTKFELMQRIKRIEEKRGHYK